jgi:predicted acylesterase/phospholipase RssA
LVLQGGALGAYEVGVLKTLSNELNGGKRSQRTKEPLFDIIACTSIGAINAAVLVSNIVNRRKSWDNALEQLESFWTDDKDGLSSNPDYSKWWENNKWWDIPGNDQNDVQSKEAARRYYSVKEYLTHGTPRVCTPPLIKGFDTKFGDQKDNLWFSHRIDPLEQTILRYSTDQGSKELKIFTSWNKKQPRLLVVAVDVYEGRTVTFDSYFKKAEDPDNALYNDDGIDLDHIMASGTLPEFYDFRKKGGRYFCDGGLLSNTPFENY